MFSQINKIRLAVAGIFLIAIMGAALDFPNFFQKLGIPLPTAFKLPFHLGLDLQGGTHLVYQADLSQIPTDGQSQSLEGVRDVIERRVNAFGVAEPLVQTTKSGDDYRIIVELAGVSDVNQAISMIGETPLLEFKVLDPNPKVDLTEEQKAEMEQKNTAAKAKAEKILSQALAPEADFSALAKTNSEEPGAEQTGGDLGFIPRGLLDQTFETACFDTLKDGEISKNLVQTQFGYHVVKREGTSIIDDAEQVNCRHILIRTVSQADFLDPNNQWLYTGLTGKELKRSNVQFDPNTQEPQISLEFNDQGKDLFATLTQENIGKPIAIFLDGSVISAPTVQNAITDGKAIISGNFSLTDAKVLAQRLNSGALPVPIHLISQQTVGASLGASTLEKSLRAGILGLIFVSVFMILFYRLPGTIAVVALLFYGLAMLAIFKLLPVTLTLSGMAGFILSLGMAVDANILVFERLKEELKQNNSLSMAIDKAFRRAWPSIYDGNISTLITCFILMSFTTSLVKGFAVTLTIGILVSMLSAMVVTKALMKFIIQFKILGNPKLFGAKK